MRSVVFLVPGQLETPTGGYIYDRRMIEGLRQRGWAVDVRALDGSFPHPTTAALEHAAQTIADVPDGRCVLVDGLAFGAMPAVIEHEAARLRIAALIHLPLGADVTNDRATTARLAAMERRALGAAALVIVTGTATLSLVAEYGISGDKVIVVEPGTARASLATHAAKESLTLLSVATLHPGKGHEILLDALATSRHRDWHLVCAGSVTRDAATADRVRAAITRLDLEQRVSLVGELDEASLCRRYLTADVFVLATLQETYGMAVAEALAHGLPVVATRTGAIPDLVGDDAGLLVPPGDRNALADALDRMLGDSVLRAQLTEGARRARRRLPTWDSACDKMSAALERLESYG